MTECLRCGYCCICPFTHIIIDPDKSWEDGSNFSVKPSFMPCPHLSFDDHGIASCAIHDHPLFETTPCHDHQTHIRRCNMGHFLRENGEDGRKFIKYPSKFISIKEFELCPNQYI